MRRPRIITGALVPILAVLGFFGAMAPAATVTPNDPGYTAYPQPLQAIHATEAWGQGTCAGVTVAVIDTGVSSIEDLSGSLLPGINAVDGSSDVTDNNGHGTAVASVIAGGVNNGIGIAGICSKVQVLPIKVARPDGSIITSDVIHAIQLATAHGARVINISLASALPPVVAQLFANAVSAAIAAGAVVVIGAGNDGKSDPSVDSEASASANAIRVGGLAMNFTQMDPGSNFGPSWVDIAAPFWIEADTTTVYPYLVYAGTSFSTPQVSAAAAMLLGLWPQMTPDQVKQFIIKGGTPIGTPDTPLPVACSCMLNITGAIAAAEAAGFPAPTGATQPTATTTPTTTVSPAIYKVTVKLIGSGAVVGFGGGKTFSWTKSGTKTIAEKMSVTLTAKPKRGWKLANWSGACKGVKLRCLTTVQGNIAVTVKFAKIATKKR